MVQMKVAIFLNPALFARQNSPPYGCLGVSMWLIR